ncbi:DNA translocase FtsK [Phyllobacterium phragmitis]|uniref:DNA translocase FtsK n=2 Tax=Phyllobacterium phragmitis TaxID=2670329 RepID=A0ABQ0H182_9HYPH
MRIQRTNFPVNPADYEEDPEGRDHPQTTGRSPVGTESPAAPGSYPPYRNPASPAGTAYQPLRPARLQPIAPKTTTAAVDALRATHAQMAASSTQPAQPSDTGYPPVWKHAFSLAENVRFTRTPEVELTKSRDVQPAQASTARPNNPVQPKPMAQVTPPRGTPATAGAPVAAAVPPRNITPVSAAPIQPSPASIAPQSVAATPQQAASAAQQHASSGNRQHAPFAHLSDFAFWESVDLHGELPSAPAAAPFRPKPQIAPSSITAMFRVVEWKQPGEPEAASPAQAPAASPAGPPAEAAPAPVAAEAPAAEPVARTESSSAIAASAPQEAHEATDDSPRKTVPVAPVATVRKEQSFAAARIELNSPAQAHGYEKPSVELLQEPVAQEGEVLTQEMLERKAGLLESVLEDFGVKGEIIHVRPGPVVTLYEFEPAPGVKSSRVIGLADDIARSMSALSARVAVVPGRNVIGIELPNTTRETVYFREMITSQDFQRSGYKLALCLGKTIGGEPVVAELAKMPHLLVAGTTGSGKSVAINTMILSLLYRLKPEECRLIMVDPKMLELSIYDGIPHLLTPVVTDPKKAVMALKWAVREMEDRYRKMSAVGVRNIDGFNSRVAAARQKGEAIVRTIQTGFDKNTGEALYEQEEMDLAPMPYIVIIVDEMADLMMVAGKEIEGAIQRLAQMARAAGIHLIMATQRPSVDVITGTIKANFPTRISFQVTSKIDSRTILGEQGAEQLLGQGDMLHMVGGGRISRVHGPFVSDEEVEKVVTHLKAQGRPDYLNTVTADEEEEEAEPEDSAVFDKGAIAAEDGDDDLYTQAVKVIMRDKKCSTSYIQRRLGIGYNRAASLVERMEKEGLVGPANHVGKREILSQNRDRNIPRSDDDDI